MQLEYSHLATRRDVMLLLALADALSPYVVRYVHHMVKDLESVFMQPRVAQCLCGCRCGLCEDADSEQTPSGEPFAHRLQTGLRLGGLLNPGFCHCDRGPVVTLGRCQVGPFAQQGCGTGQGCPFGGFKLPASSSLLPQALSSLGRVVGVGDDRLSQWHAAVLICTGLPCQPATCHLSHADEASPCRGHQARHR